MTGPVLSRQEIIRAIRIRKLLEQAAAEGEAGAAYQAKAVKLARGYARGTAIVYDGKLLLDGNGNG
jgi:hypothetical protein